MRPVHISEDDDALFNASFTPRVAVTYQNHLKEIRRMVKQQGIGFWIRFVTSFRSHNERHRLMDGIVFPRAEAVFVDMLHLLTCGDNLNELSTLILSLRAMQAAITANDYQVLMDPVLRVLMTYYDKPLDGLRLYFRFAAGLVVVFRRWRQAAWRGGSGGGGGGGGGGGRQQRGADEEPCPWPCPCPPWEPPIHWQEPCPQRVPYAEWTFEGHLLQTFGPALPRLLNLPPGLPCWLPDHMKNALYHPLILEEIPVMQNGRNNRNRKKCKRRKNRSCNEFFGGYEPYSASPFWQDSRECIVEQDQYPPIINPAETNKERNCSLFNGCKETPTSSQFEKDTDTSGGSEKISGEMGEQKNNSEAPIAISSPSNSENSAKEDVEIQHTDERTTTQMFTRNTGDSTEPHFVTSYVNECEYCNIAENYPVFCEKCFQYGGNKFNRSHYFRTSPYDERPEPDYLSLLGCHDMGLSQNGQYMHPGGLPVLEQNYGPLYDECYPPYRRDVPPRMMLGVSSSMEDGHLLGRPPPLPPSWVDQSPFVPPFGFTDPPPPPPPLPLVAENFGAPPPLAEVRRRGPPNRRFRPRRSRPPGPACDSPELNQRRPWQSRRRDEVAESEDALAKDKIEAPGLKDLTTEVVPEVPPSLNTPTSGGESSFQPTKCYALALCGLLGRQPGRSNEPRKQDIVKQENNPCADVLSPKAMADDKSCSKKSKGKSVKLLADDNCEKIEKPIPGKDSVKETEKMALSIETENSEKDMKSKNPKDKIENVDNVSVVATEKSKKEVENNVLSCPIENDEKLNDYRRNSYKSPEGEKTWEKRRKWKSVWTRRRKTGARPDENTTVETDIPKYENDRHDSERRDGIPENVPDILKQVENSELKSFWKENNEAPKPQRKSRPSKRETRMKQVTPGCSSESSFERDEIVNEVTPVIKLDIVPAVEPKDKDTLIHDKNTVTQLEAIEHHTSEIGWYEESLAEDKRIEDGRELCTNLMQTEESQKIGNLKKNKNRKWKRKQRNNRKAKDEKKRDESLVKENSMKETIVSNDHINQSEAKHLHLNMLQNESKSVVTNEDVLQASKIVLHDTLKQTIFNGYVSPAIKIEPKNENILRKQIGLKVEPECVTSEEEKSNKQIIDYDKNINCCQEIIQEIVLHLPLENLHQSKCEQSKHPLQEINNSLDGVYHDSIDCCKSILEDLLCNLPENMNSFSKGTTLKKVCKNASKGKNRSLEKYHIIERIFSPICKIKESDVSIIHRRRQACLAKILKYLAIYKFSIPLPTKRDFFRQFFGNSEIMKIIEEPLKKESGIESCFSILSRKSHRNLQPSMLLSKKIYLMQAVFLSYCDNNELLEKIVGANRKLCIKEIPIHLSLVSNYSLCLRTLRRHQHTVGNHNSQKDCNENT